MLSTSSFGAQAVSGLKIHSARIRGLELEKIRVRNRFDHTSGIVQTAGRDEVPTGLGGTDDKANKPSTEKKVLKLQRCGFDASFH